MAAGTADGHTTLAPSLLAKSNKKRQIRDVGYKKGRLHIADSDEEVFGTVSSGLDRLLLSCCNWIWERVSHHLRSGTRAVTTEVTSSSTPWRLSGAKVAKDAPIAESESDCQAHYYSLRKSFGITSPEGIGHGIANVGPAQDCQRDAEDGVKDGHHFGCCCLWCNMAISWESDKT